jgi:hypothetical protein
MKIYVCTWLHFLFVNMVSKLKLFNEKVERDLKLDFFKKLELESL